MKSEIKTQWKPYKNDYKLKQNSKESMFRLDWGYRKDKREKSLENVLIHFLAPRNMTKMATPSQIQVFFLFIILW